MNTNKPISFASALLLILLSTGCKSLGPRAVKWERTPYNLAIQETQDEQLLLNLVRLKYRDTPVFLELSSIASQFTLESGFSTGDSGLAEVQSGNTLWRPGGLSLAYSAQPTITYTPLQGEKFAQQLLAPLNIETLMLLYRSGWPLKRVLRVCVQRLNHVENAVRASGPTPEVAPEYERFARVLELMGQLNDRGQLDLVYAAPTPTNASARIMLQIAASAFGLPEMQELWRLLGLVPQKQQYPVTLPLIEEAGRRELDHLEVETRSVQGVLFFLSQAVEVPEADLQAGRVTVTRTPTGEVFDWRNVIRQSLHVQSATKRPGDAAISVGYRGAWFYIGDSDLSSKSTFALLTQLVALQSGEVSRLTPVLTLPVGK